MSAWDLAVALLFLFVGFRIIRLEVHVFKLARTLGRYMMEAHPEEAAELRRTDPELVRTVLGEEKSA